MALTKDQYLQNQEDQFNPQLMQLKLQKLQAAKKAQTEGINSLNEQRDQQLPSYTENANSVDARAAQNVQKLRETMAANGMYRSGTTVSDTAMMQNQAASDIAKIGRDKEQFLGGINSKIGQLNQGYADEEKNAENEYTANLQANRAKALDQWSQMEMQQKAAAVSRARASGGVPNISALNRQDKLNAQDATAGALDALYRDAPNMSRTELTRAIQQMSGQWYRDGVDMKEIKQALEGVQTRDEIEAEQKAAYQDKLKARPWYQRAIDAVLPGSQWG